MAKEPVAEFCERLRALQQYSGLSRAELARRMPCSRSQFYQVLDGEIRRPPDWERVVEPLVRACTGDDESAVREWRQQHGALVRFYDLLQLRRRERPPDRLRPADQMARGVPAQLPADVDGFTGRTTELTELDRLLHEGADHPATAVVITAVAGTAGVGKTALALRWAHRVRSEFPDGQLYVNLRGYDPDQPMAAEDALAGFLRGLGVAGPDIPLELDERAAYYRSLLDGRRVLVVLDNAGSVEQIRPLLPGTRSCLVLVTSRDSLAGLVARHGARRLNLDLLPPDDAVALLGTLIGGRVDEDPAAAWGLAEQCARLPLALRVAAELAATRTATSLSTLVEELTDEQRRLERFDAGDDPRTALRTVFSWSYQHLPSDTDRAFRLLGLHPGPHVTPYATAALADTSVEWAQQVLDLLARVHLIQPIGPSRYGMHDLLRAYALGLANDKDSAQERRAARTRLFDHYLATCAAAMDTLIPAERHRRPRILPPSTLSPPMTDPTIARTWLDTERPTLTAICVYTATHGWPNHTTSLATIMFRYLDIGGHYPDALTIHTHALDVARRTGDRAAEAHTLTDLGTVDWRQGRYDQAIAHHQQALTLAREIGDRAVEAHTLSNLGLVYWRQGCYDQAAEHHQQALTLAREIGDQGSEAETLTNLGVVYWRQGHYHQAAEHHQQALTLARQIGDRGSEAYALTNLGLVDHRLGRNDQAIEHHEQALALTRGIVSRATETRTLTNLGLIYRRHGQLRQAAEHFPLALEQSREIGERAGEARALDNLGSIYLRQSDVQQAAEHHKQALAIYREIGERAGEAEALNGLGETHRASGELGEARLLYTDALTLATEIGEPYAQARAHNSLAHIHHTTGDPDQARQHWSQAFAHYTDLGVPEAEEVRTQLMALDAALDGSAGDGSAGGEDFDGVREVSGFGLSDQGIQPADV